MQPSGYVMGIDPSLKATGLLVLDYEGAIQHKSVVGSEVSGGMVNARMARISKIVTEIKSVIDANRPDVICIEAYAVGQNTPGTADRIELGGLLRYVMWRGGYRVIEVGNSTLKKFACGKGSGDKTGLIAAITANYGVQFGSSDEYDSYALARMALQISGREESRNQIQRDAIKLVTTEKMKKPRAKKVKP